MLIVGGFKTKHTIDRVMTDKLMINRGIILVFVGGLALLFEQNIVNYLSKFTKINKDLLSSILVIVFLGGIALIVVGLKSRK